MVLDRQKYNRHHRESLELLTSYLKKNGIDLKKQYPRVQAFCKLQSLECPEKKMCSDWLVDLYRSGTNHIIRNPYKKKINQSQKERYKHPDEDELDNFDKKLFETTDDFFISVWEAKRLLIKYYGYNDNDIDIKKYFNIGELKKFIETRSPDHNQYLKSIKWSKIKQYVRDKYNYHCQKCGKNMADDTYNLHTHHLTYDRLGNEDVDKDLTLLCRTCHNEVHKNWDWKK